MNFKVNFLPSSKTTGIATALALLTFGVAACNPQETASENTTSDTEASSSEAADLPGEGISVVPAYAILEERFQTEVVNIGLEQLGYEVEPLVEVDYTALFLDMSNGNITYTPAHWRINQDDLFENSGGDEVLEREGSIIADTLQGYMIDKATAEEYGITTLDQLADPEIAALFDTDGDGRANLIGCDAAWLCASMTEHHIDEYGLRDTVQHEQGRYIALLADIVASYEQGQPILYYSYTPFWMQNVLKEGEDVVWLEVPYTSLPEGQGDEVTEAETTVNGVNLGFPVQDQMIVANQAFVDENPAASQFFSLIEIPIEDVNAQNQLLQDGEDDPEQIRAHAEAWVEANQAQFDEWVEAALAAQ
ncbi:glycine betaine/L-proline ABC transporter substrate-binding protein ProX [Vacuolonema iberomarrocanum]|uniref:glycine betaine/L-proline ABC transporter substrate-binding protein ProX n=1 Tax=Vacuolonema iberomarrocanum TaxID=3454632 RepID=UPI0019E1BF0A|nr:glycine betaine/L-proline ABC transporter substrate-binding protein ProX [filamentous cyanobacterium LEGE 07170]